MQKLIKFMYIRLHYSKLSYKSFSSKTDIFLLILKYISLKLKECGVTGIPLFNYNNKMQVNVYKNSIYLTIMYNVTSET